MLLKVCFRMRHNLFQDLGGNYSLAKDDRSKDENSYTPILAQN